MSHPLRRILVATDLSPGADEALRQAHERAVAAQAELAVCHVVPSLLRSHVLFPQLGLRAVLEEPDLRQTVVRLVTARVAEVTGRDEQGFTLIIEEGTPHAEVLRWADEWKADLVVVGSQGATGIARLLLGSVADKIVRHAAVPVLLARAHARTGRLVVGTDFSDPALPAVQAAAEEARRTGARVTIVHSLELHLPMATYAAVSFGVALVPRLPTDVESELRRIVDERLQEALRSCGVDGDRRVTDGPAGAALVRASEELDADVVVVGTKGRTGLKRALLGSVAETVARTAPCSVLVVRLA